MKTLNIIFEPTDKNFNTVKEILLQRERKVKNNRKQSKRAKKKKVKFIDSHTHARKNDVAHTKEKKLTQV